MDGVAEAFVYDPVSNESTGNNVVLDFGGSSLSRRWLHGTSVDEPIAFETYSSTTFGGSGTSYDVFADRLGSVLSVVDAATGLVASESQYNSFGARLQTGSLEQRYGFTAREHDLESGLVYYRARHYDPIIGQFIQSDPIEFLSGDLNIYSYVDNDPVNAVDPSGLFLNTQEQARLSGASAATAVSSTQRVAAGATGLAATLGWTLWNFCEVYTGYPGCFEPEEGTKPEVQSASGGANGGAGGPQTTRPGRCGEIVAHGNSRASELYTVLYALYDSETGYFLKYGVTSQTPPERRYSAGESVRMIILDGGCRNAMLNRERELVSSEGRPWNMEPWSSFIGPRQPR